MAYVSIINKHGQVTIPKDIRRARGWKAGTRIRIIQGDEASMIMRAGKMPHSKPELYFASSMSDVEFQELQHQVQAGTLLRLAEGIYIPLMPEEELAALVRQYWHQVAGTIAPGGVISHLSAMKRSALESGVLILSHPTLPASEVILPGLQLHILQGHGPLPGDIPLGTTGLHFSGRTRMLLENLGPAGEHRASAADAETQLVALLDAFGG